jgi:hypothetical protein
MNKPRFFRTGLKMKFSKQRTIMPILCNQACGLIFQPCDGTRHSYFTSQIPTGAAVVRLRNDGVCRMRAIFTTRCRHIEQTVSQGQQIVVALKSLYQLAIECGDCEETGPPCRGQFEIQWSARAHAAN